MQMVKEESASERADPAIVIEFRLRHASLIEECRRAAELTATEQWQELYGNNRRVAKANRDLIAAYFGAAAQSLRRGWLPDDSVKEIKAALKDNDDGTFADAEFARQVLQPIRNPVEVLAQLIESTARQVQQVEQREPLIYSGLYQRFAEELRTLPKAAWNDGDGTVTVR